MKGKKAFESPQGSKGGTYTTEQSAAGRLPNSGLKQPQHMSLFFYGTERLGVFPMLTYHLSL